MRGSSACRSRRRATRLVRKTLKLQAAVVEAMAEGASEAELATVAEVMQRVSGRLEALLSSQDTALARLQQPEGTR